MPSRVLELEARFGTNRASLGNDADAFIFGRTLDIARSDSTGPVGSLAPLGSPTQVNPVHTGRVVNDDGTLADGVPYADLFRSAGAAHGIQPSVLAAVAKTESAFDPNAVSHAGAQGLMQFMPGTAAEMGVDPYDPASAIDGAARYLSQNLRRFGSLELALAAYNAGPGAVQQHGGIPPFAETQAYV
ncbi:MAG: lytic transglycosylase domain-containing protein, partial [Acidimicrobiales bacterium]|nr:lytic transglycosylase domain-containing protein [Acidimicrobiales bacterium]